MTYIDTQISVGNLAGRGTGVRCLNSPQMMGTSRESDEGGAQVCGVMIIESRRKGDGDLWWRERGRRAWTPDSHTPNSTMAKTKSCQRTPETKL